MRLASLYAGITRDKYMGFGFVFEVPPGMSFMQNMPGG